jgi:Cdc6-like AAA superfamily ATPase
VEAIVDNMAAQGAPPAMTTEEKIRRKSLIHSTFTPTTPINRLDLFSGREQQVDRVLGAVFSPGQHAAIYGERGVGKSSLANIIYDMVVATGRDTFIPARIICSAAIAFHEIWREIFRQLSITQGPESESLNLEDQLSDTPNSEEIRVLFEKVRNPSIIVVDEFDRTEHITATFMADTIKTLSDTATNTTLVIVGVADSIDQLIEEHASVIRAIVQIRMPRMSAPELIGIIDNGMHRLEMTIDDGLKSRIANLSQGLPHYTHLLAKHAALQAINNSRTQIHQSDFEFAIKVAVEDKSQTLGRDYQRATYSPKENIFGKVLLACALAAGENGFFSAKDVRSPLSQIMGESRDIQAYIRHLNKFSQEPRGPILKKEGKMRRFQYRFVEPMMQSYVLMKGLADGLITEEQVNVL